MTSLSGVQVKEPPLLEVVMGLTSCRSPEEPWRRRMVTGRSGSAPVHLRVTGLPASRGSLGQEVKDRGSAARPTDTMEAVTAITLLEKCIVRNESNRWLGFKESEIISKKGCVVFAN